ncbi:MAG: DNA-directed RNA polymerase subunit D [Candidatus Woesearchaeota archaeon]
MKLELLSKSKESWTVRMQSASPEQMNTLRRIIMDEVPTMAIDDIEFKQNSGILYDEVIALRLGLVPIKTDLKSYTLVSESKAGKGSPDTEVVMTLKAKGPKLVTAGDLKSKDPKVIPVFPDTPIVNLLEGQELELMAKAVLGQGKDHAKFQPALAWYKNTPSVTIKKQPKDPEAVSKRCPVKVFDAKGGKLTIKNESACILCGECAEMTEGDVQVTTKDDFTFTIESFGQLSPKEILTAATERFTVMLDDFSQALKKAE